MCFKYKKLREIAPLPKFILRPGEPPQKNDSTITEALLSTIRK